MRVELGLARWQILEIRPRVFDEKFYAFVDPQRRKCALTQPTVLRPRMHACLDSIGPGGVHISSVSVGGEQVAHVGALDGLGEAVLCGRVLEFSYQHGDLARTAREALDLAGFSSDDLHEWKHLDPELLAQLLVVVKEDLVL